MLCRDLFQCLSNIFPKKTTQSGTYRRKSNLVNTDTFRNFHHFVYRILNIFEFSLSSPCGLSPKIKHISQTIIIGIDISGIKFSVIA